MKYKNVMNDKLNDQNNQAIVEGEIVSDFEYSHHVFGEGFYFVKLKVSRLSDSKDIVPLLVSDRLIDVHQDMTGRIIVVKGQFRSFNRRDEEGNHLILSLFVKELMLLDHQYNSELNSVFLDGYVCKEPVYRTTPMGREITDAMIAVNRSFSKTDYIPCIFWGRNARFAGHLPIGSRVQLWGRIQSRDFRKRTDPKNSIRRVAYEISVNKMEFREEHIHDYDMVAESGYGYMYG